MNKRTFNLIFPPALIKEPVICRMAREFPSVDFAIHRAFLTAMAAEMTLQLNGEDAEINQVVAWLKTKGVDTTPVHEMVEN